MAETLDEMVRRIAEQTARAVMHGYLEAHFGPKGHENSSGEHANRCNVCDRVFASPHAVRVHHGKTDCGLTR